MNDNEKFIDVESLPVDKGQQVAWDNCFQNNVNGYGEPKKKKRRGVRILGKIAGLLLLTVTGGAIGGGITYSEMKSNKATSAQQISYVPQSFTSSDSTAMSAADAFNKVAPAVVIISTKGQQSTNAFSSGEVEGMGSGFIINEDGYILTNYHVIAGAKEITVTLSDNTEVSASVVNYDDKKDIAMLKLKDGTKVPAVAELGDSDAIYPGAEVIAIGTPLSKNFAQTLTKGVISGKNRTIEGENGTSVDLIQTDAAINPGNSGGPLVNTKGQVIGINSMKVGSQAAGDAGVEGIGFAIPINDVKSKIDTLSKQILNLGIQIREIDSATAKKNNLPEGIYVMGVDEFSPGEKGGLKIGDIIVKADGKTVKTVDDLKAVKEGKNAGDTINLDVIRNNKTINVSVVLEAQK
ncbi:trypsin-like peptidase domain-containing protein [Clostridium sp.]|uniref:S1C family serine protease n=1 Tax=Clostridium sp. TaxID=1506 RepID=UPI0028432BF1|nr:trypsin-like peptidase domain-containing protein [Clostridium sp.]MDR3596863.1 trypsin-like peptidase domain-containing protein [Clostridium sp.]